MSRTLVAQARCFASDRRATSAVEFALALPFMLVVYLGGYQVTQGVSAYRKVTLTARTVADLTTQYTQMSASDVTTVMNASAQVMAPFNTSSLVIVLTEYYVSAAGIATVTWSKSLNGTALTAGAIVTLPVNICLPNSSIVMSTVTYSYTPPIGYKLTGPIVMSNHLYMSPRSVASVAYTG